MPLIELFFRQSVTIHPFIRLGAGEPIYAMPETRKCRFERGRKNGKSFNPSGVANQTPAGARMYCTGSPIPVGSLVDYENHSYVVTQCTIMNGFTDDHLEVILQ